MDTRRLTDESEIDWTLQQLSTHRETHVHWRDHFRKGPCTDCSPDVIKNVGDLAEQEASVGHYDRMIAAVKSLRADAVELARALIRSGVGQHDMYECRLCGREGHNLVAGAYGALTHEPECILSRPTVVELRKEKD